MAKAAPAKHKIRVATRRRWIVGGLPLGIMGMPATCDKFCKTQTELFNGAAKMTKMRCQQMERRTNADGKGAAILFAPALALPAAICAPPLPPPAISYIFVISAASQKLQIDGDWRTFKTLSLLS